MKIVICGSLDFTYQIEKIAIKLRNLGHQVTIPKVSKMILNGKVSLKQILNEKKTGEIFKRAIKLDVLKYYFNKIKKADAILVVNLDKDGVKNYIGGNTFLEMGFAYVLGKKIFLLNPIPDVPYRTEIKAMQPIILNGKLDTI